MEQRCHSSCPVKTVLLGLKALCMLPMAHFSLFHYHYFTSQDTLKMDINLNYIKCNADENWVQSI